MLFQAGDVHATFVVRFVVGGGPPPNNLRLLNSLLQEEPGEMPKHVATGQDASRAWQSRQRRVQK